MCPKEAQKLWVNVGFIFASYCTAVVWAEESHYYNVIFQFIQSFSSHFCLKTILGTKIAYLNHLDYLDSLFLYIFLKLEYKRKN